MALTISLAPQVVRNGGQGLILVSPIFEEEEECCQSRVWMELWQWCATGCVCWHRA